MGFIDEFINMNKLVELENKYYNVSVNKSGDIIEVKLTSEVNINE